jgi:YHS domain-containing protein
MTSFRLVALLALLGAPLAGCETPRHAQQESTAHATCPVCQCEGDLACVDVKVNERTPRYEWNGTVYYFCSEDCRARFARAPKEFLAR